METNNNPMPEKLDLGELLANIDNKIIDTQNSLEDATREYIKFREAFTNAKLAYERAFAVKIKELKSKEEYRKEQVTFLKEVALNDCWDLYKEMITKEQKYKEVSALCRAFQERLNSIKKIKGGSFSYT